MAEITAPSYSLPSAVLICPNEKLLMKMVLQTLVAMNIEKPDPNPYPLRRSSSRSRTMKPEMKS
jgi:hypothetical protein